MGLKFGRTQTVIPDWRPGLRRHAMPEISIMLEARLNAFQDHTHTVRFALLESGMILAGDAYEVMHMDIAMVGPRIEEGEALLTGVARRTESQSMAVWRIEDVQSMVSGKHNPAMLRKLLVQLNSWVLFCAGYLIVWKDLDSE